MNKSLAMVGHLDEDKETKRVHKNVNKCKVPAAVYFIVYSTSDPRRQDVSKHIEDPRVPGKMSINSAHSRFTQLPER